VENVMGAMRECFAYSSLPADLKDKFAARPTSRRRFGVDGLSVRSEWTLACGFVYSHMLFLYYILELLYFQALISRRWVPTPLLFYFADKISIVRLAYSASQLAVAVNKLSVESSLIILCQYHGATAGSSWSLTKWSRQLLRYR